MQGTGDTDAASATLSERIEEARKKKTRLPIAPDAIPLGLSPNSTRQAIAARNRSAPGKVTGRLARALAAMVWQGLERADAAAQSGMTDHSLREALRKPHVKAHYLELREVLRLSALAKNIHALVEIRDQKDNHTARVAAIKTLETLNDDAPPAAGQAQRAGVMFVIKGNVEVSARYSDNEPKTLNLQANVQPPKRERE